MCFAVSGDYGNGILYISMSLAISSTQNRAWLGDTCIGAEVSASGDGEGTILQIFSDRGVDGWSG